MSQHRVDAVRARRLAVRAFAFHGPPHDAADKIIARVGEQSLAVLSGVLFHLMYDVFDQCGLGRIEPDRVAYQRVPFHQLGGSVTHRISPGPRLVFHQMRYGVQRLVHVARTDIVYGRDLPPLRHFHGPCKEPARAFVPAGRDGHHRYPQLALEPAYVDAVPEGAHLVHHVERDHHRRSQFGKL